MRPSSGVTYCWNSLQGLPAEVGAVDEEEDAPGPGELDQPVDGGDGREGLAAAGGHLDRGRGGGCRERLFEVLDGAVLGGPEPRGAWTSGRSGRGSGGGEGPAGCREDSASSQAARTSGRWKWKRWPAARLGVEVVREAGLDARGG